MNRPRYNGIDHSRFTGELDVRVLWREPAVDGGKVLYQLLSPFGFRSAEFGMISAPPGAIIDFASIPQWAQSCVGKEHPAVLVGSVPHDVGYEAKGWGVLTREDVDQIMREAMECVGSTEFHRRIIYNAVRLGGGKAWRT